MCKERTLEDQEEIYSTNPLPNPNLFLQNKLKQKTYKYSTVNHQSVEIKYNTENTFISLFSLHTHKKKHFSALIYIYLYFLQMKVLYKVLELGKEYFSNMGRERSYFSFAIIFFSTSLIIILFIIMCLILNIFLTHENSSLPFLKY